MRGVDRTRSDETRSKDTGPSGPTWVSLLAPGRRRARPFTLDASSSPGKHEAALSAAAVKMAAVGNLWVCSKVDDPDEEPWPLYPTEPFCESLFATFGVMFKNDPEQVVVTPGVSELRVVPLWPAPVQPRLFGRRMVRRGGELVVRRNVLLPGERVVLPSAMRAAQRLCPYPTGAVSKAARARFIYESTVMGTTLEDVGWESLEAAAVTRLASYSKFDECVAEAHRVCRAVKLRPSLSEQRSFTMKPDTAAKVFFTQVQRRVEYEVAASRVGVDVASVAELVGEGVPVDAVVDVVSAAFG